MKKTKTLIVKELVEETGLPQKQVEPVLKEYLWMLQKIVLQGDRFNWRSFGTFFLKERKPRKVKDFSTGERKTVALSPIPAFTPSKGLLNAVAPNKKPIRESKDDKGVEVDHEKKQQRVVRSFEVSKVENKKKRKAKLID